MIRLITTPLKVIGAIAAAGVAAVALVVGYLWRKDRQGPEPTEASASERETAAETTSEKPKEAKEKAGPPEDTSAKSTPEDD